MLLSSDEIKEKIEQGLLVQDLVDLNIQLQQNGVDVTAAKVFSLEGEGVMDFDNSKRKLPEYKEVPIHDDKWILEPGTYHIALGEKIVLPIDVGSVLLPRSSALTCGIVQHSAWWDPGYEGRGFFHIEVTKKVTIHKNARLGQMIFFRSTPTKAYQGRYKGEDILRDGSRVKSQS